MFFRVVDDKGRDITEDCLTGFRAERMMRDMQAARKQQEAAAIFPEEQGIYTGRGASKTLMARVLAHITPEVYWHWIAREGPKCWDDPAFVRRMLDEHPELRARVTCLQGHVSMAGLGDRVAAIRGCR